MVVVRLLLVVLSAAHSSSGTGSISATYAVPVVTAASRVSFAVEGDTQPLLVSGHGVAATARRLSVVRVVSAAYVAGQYSAYQRPHIYGPQRR